MYSDTDCSHCFPATKRWDILAFHEFGEIHANFFAHFRCEVSGGAGGVGTPLAVTPISPSVPKMSKSSQKQKDLADESQKQFFKELVSAIRPDTLKYDAELLQVSSTLRELVASKDDDDVDIITHYQKRKKWLRCGMFLSTTTPPHPTLPHPILQPSSSSPSPPLFFQREQILQAEQSNVD